mmetsp:Transcript_26222/g.52273  ORF Transcript_26222/g.52273 Transcript_26222/m.52273 type:complete len:549 (-) Transcript_26222:281-1927(-)|eukprot:CAMPEP_0194340672 /NCGR_PEP_ID=MMETSP0171-20130528/87229_1 /TAXON_ID=218684 /ORGANISM="Corethron pennatum, Strain L29A3" /LENGTH=548 /DNA_ID=CAMNT_0039105725 /DNA_START=111 /DNA_END=1757 /DNA_ORIENTATION=-
MARNFRIGWVALAVIIAVGGNTVKADESSPMVSVEESPDLYTCPRHAFGEWDVEECAIMPMKIASSGPDESYFELDTTTDYSGIIENMEIPSYEGSLVEHLKSSNADSFLVYHKGRLVYEKYRADLNQGAFSIDYTEGDKHFLYSVTKSFMGMVFAKLLYTVEDFNEDDPVVDWVPKLANAPAFNTTTVRMIADMSSNFEWNENNPQWCDIVEFFTELTNHALNGFEGGFPITQYCEFVLYNYVDGGMNLAAVHTNSGQDYTFEDIVSLFPKTKNEIMKILRRGNTTGLREDDGLPAENGAAFRYQTINADVLALICDSVIQETYPGKYEGVFDYFQKEIWEKLGTDEDFTLTVDMGGIDNWGRGGSTAARDLLRIGIMLLNDGKNHMGDQVLPKGAVDDIFDGSDLSRSQLSGRGNNSNPAFTSAVHPELKVCEQMTGGDWSYRNQCYSYNPSGETGTGEIAYMNGFYGQWLYVDKKADLVLVQQAVDVDFLSRYAQSVAYLFALSMYFRCNPEIGSDVQASDVGTLGMSVVSATVGAFTATVLAMG